MPNVKCEWCASVVAQDWREFHRLPVATTPPKTFRICDQCWREYVRDVRSSLREVDKICAEIDGYRIPLDQVQIYDGAVISFPVECAMPTFRLVDYQTNQALARAIVKRVQEIRAAERRSFEETCRAFSRSCERR